MVNYEDERLVEVEQKQTQAIADANKTYDDMINQTDQFYNAQIDAAKNYGEVQAKNQQAQTDFAIEQINQQKEQAEKDYIKEQSGAYVDWQKESNKYGANAEQMAAGGLENTGYSESSQVSQYNTYQNRVAAARDSYNRATLNYDNAIKDAQLQNNAKLAEIAVNTLQAELELALTGFQYKNQLVLDKLNMKTQLEQMYHSQWQDVLNQINTENSLAEEIRQYNTSLAEEQRQFNILHGGSSGGSSGRSSGGSSGGSGGGYTIQNTGEITSDETYEVNTAYYQGSLNSDAKEYGTFKNGYQPKGISGHGTLSKTGDYVEFDTTTLSGETKHVKQNLWKASDDGTIWYWEGRENQYKPFEG